MDLDNLKIKVAWTKAFFPKRMWQPNRKGLPFPNIPEGGATLIGGEGIVSAFNWKFAFIPAHIKGTKEHHAWSCPSYLLNHQLTSDRKWSEPHPLSIGEHKSFSAQSL